MQYWVCYDIADDGRRERLAKVLLDFGKRVEESVFHCHVDGMLAEEMVGRIRRTIDEAFDKVHVLPLCQACAEKIVTCGIAGQDPDPEFMIV